MIKHTKDPARTTANYNRREPIRNIFEVLAQEVGWESQRISDVLGFPNNYTVETPRLQT